MRLRDLAAHLSFHVRLQYEEAGIPGSSPQAFTLTKKGVVLDALRRIRQVAPLESDALYLIGHSMITAPSVAQPERNDFKGKLDALRLRSADLYSLVTSVLHEQDPESIAVRIPEPEDIDGIEDVVGDLRLVFQDPVKRYFGEAAPVLRFQGFDTGTSWIELCGYTGVVLKFTFALLWAANAYRVAAAKARQEEARAEALEASADQLKRMAEHQNDLLELQLKQLTKGVIEGYASHRSQSANIHEASNSVRKSITTWGAMLDRGAAVRPALNASSETRDVFPNPTSDDLAQLTEQLTKLLGTGEAVEDPETGSGSQG
jgi:hypothetical protein